MGVRREQVGSHTCFAITFVKTHKKTCFSSFLFGTMNPNTQLNKTTQMERGWCFFPTRLRQTLNSAHEQRSENES